jgi:hypothetical protein
MSQVAGEVLEASPLLDKLVEQWNNNGPYLMAPVTSYPARISIEQLSPVDQAALATAAAHRCTTDWSYAAHFVRDTLLKRELPFAAQQIVALAAVLTAPKHRESGPDTIVLGAIERWAERNAVPEQALAHLSEAKDNFRIPLRTEARSAADRIDYLLGLRHEVGIVEGEAWADAAIAAIESCDDALREAWTALINHCHLASASTPTAKWQKQAQKLLADVGVDEFRSRFVEWISLVDRPRTTFPRDWVPEESPASLLWEEMNAQVLKGMAWIAAGQSDRDVARVLGHAAMAAFKKLPRIGPRAIKLGNACVYALGAMPGQEGLAQLALLKVKVKFGTAQKGIEKALTAVAERLGLPRDEIEELAVPTYGLEEVGVRRETLGDFTAELVAAADGSTALRWRKADGKLQKSVPAAVKSEFAEDLKELKAAAKDIAKMLPAQKDRIDNLYLASKSWPLATWRERYLDHPLLGVLARGLLWEFTSGGQSQTGGFLADAAAGQLVGLDDEPLVLADDSTVQLWHPIGRPTTEVLAWREWLERHQIRQPFKQAHREVYVLTDAERNTRVYSNRFAAHIVKQHQYNALCGIRGWKNQLRLMVDSSYPPTTRDLPPWGLRAEFWVEGAGDQYGTDTNETGTYLYLATDQVRFYPQGAPEVYAHASGGGYGRYQGPVPEPIPLEEIPPLVFSEIMRDVDLFVGVASVGNDPNWLDGGREGRYVDYWERYSFGDLSATAQTRKAVLERIVPRLAIGSRCSFEDKFLVVEGKLRTYKIHLGSGNILMKPNDEYLCIVPSRGEAAAGDKVFLPFEGDRTLSIVLSKALLLAADDKITDPTITHQIGRR